MCLPPTSWRCDGDLSRKGQSHVNTCSFHGVRRPGPGAHLTPSCLWAPSSRPPPASGRLPWRHLPPGHSPPTPPPPTVPTALLPSPWPSQWGVERTWLEATVGSQAELDREGQGADRPRGSRSSFPPQVSRISRLLGEGDARVGKLSFKVNT